MRDLLGFIHGYDVVQNFISISVVVPIHTFSSFHLYSLQTFIGLLQSLQKNEMVFHFVTVYPILSGIRCFWFRKQFLNKTKFESFLSGAFGNFIKMRLEGN